MKLYMITLRGLQYSATGPKFGSAYAIANNAAEAYEKVRSTLASRDVGFPADREMQSVTLLAEDTTYPVCGCLLYL